MLINVQINKKMHCTMFIQGVLKELKVMLKSKLVHSYLILFHSCTIDTELVIIMEVIVLTCTGCKNSVEGSRSCWSVVCHSLALVQISWTVTITLP